MVEIFATLKCEQKEIDLNELIGDNSENNILTQQRNYENLIRKLESDLRNYLKVQFFLYFLIFFYIFLYFFIFFLYFFYIFFIFFIKNRRNLN